MKVNLLTKLYSDVGYLVGEDGEGIFVEKVEIIANGSSPSVTITLEDLNTHLKDLSPKHPKVILKLEFPFLEEPTTEIKGIERTSEKFKQGLFKAIPKLQKYFWEEFIYEELDDDEE